MRQKLKKLQRNFYVLSMVFAGSAVFAQPCVECTKLSQDLEGLAKSKASYLDLQKKNEAFLSKPGISEGAAIKAKSNMMIIALKVETFNNMEIELQEKKKKLNNCAQCPTPKPGQS